MFIPKYNIYPIPSNAQGTFRKWVRERIIAERQGEGLQNGIFWIRHSHENCRLTAVGVACARSASRQGLWWPYASLLLTAELFAPNRITKSLSHCFHLCSHK